MLLVCCISVPVVMWMFVLLIFIIEYLQKQKAYEGYEYDNGFTSIQTEFLVIQGGQGANSSLPLAYAPDNADI